MVECMQVDLDLESTSASARLANNNIILLKRKSLICDYITPTPPTPR